MAEEVKTEENTADKVRGKPFQKGDDPRRNLEGRPTGAEGFKTIFEKALKHLAALNDKDPEDLYTEIVSNAIKSARKGNYRFYKDMLDRLYGTPTNKIDHTTGGKPFNEEKVKELASSIFNGPDNKQG